MGKNKIILILIFIMLFAGISCVSAENIDDVSNLSTEDMDAISIDDESDMLADSSGSISVYNWTELGSAVYDDNNISTVYLGANITPGSQILIRHNVTIIGSADTYIGGSDYYNPVSYSNIPIYSTETGLSITLKNIRFQNSGGNILMKFSGNGNYVLDNCTFVNVNATGSHQAVVYLNYGYGDIINCTFENCTTSYGAVSNYNERSVNNVHMTVRDSTFKNNHATTEPGAINNCGQLIVYDSTFEGNSAAWWAGAIHTHTNANTTVVRSNFKKNVAGWDGGALYTYSHLTVIDSNFTENKGSNGGAITAAAYGSRPDLTVINCEFDSNVAPGSGGAISFGVGEMTIEDSRFYNNVASNNGGAVSVSGSTSVISNCEFKNDSTTSKSGKGGAVYWNSANGRIVESSFMDCQANDGGSVYWNGANGTLSTSSFMNSHAENCGGGIYFSGANCTLIDPIFEECSAQNGSDWYSEQPLNVIISTVLNVGDVTTSYGISKDLIVTLTDFYNNILVGEQIAIVFNDVEYSLITNSSGQVSISIPDNLVPKTYTATISYAGNEIYSASTTTVNVIVNKADLTIDAQDIDVAYNDNGELVATLINANNDKAIVNAKVIFTINGASYTVKTSSDGRAKLSTNGLVPGDYVATIVYNGNNKYNAVNTTANVHVDKADLTIDASDVSVAYNDDGELVATLTNNGKAIVNAKVIFTVNGASYTVKTSSDGQAILSTNGLVPGDYVATIVYNGNDKYNAVNTAANIHVDKVDVNISAVYDDEADKLIATFANAVSGKAVANAHVNINLGGVNYTVKTDANGQAKVSTASLSPGDYAAAISYKGNIRYNPSKTTFEFVID